MRAAPLFAVAGAACALAGAASGQTPTTQQEQMPFAGDVLPGCTMAAPVISGATNTTSSNVAAGTADLTVTRLVGDDGVPVGAQVVLTLESACNQSHTLSLDSVRGGMTNGETAPNGQFRTVLPYSVTLSWAGVTQTFSSADPALAAAIGSAARGPLTVSITIPSGGTPLVAGAYSDQLVLELGAAG